MGQQARRARRALATLRTTEKNDILDRPGRGAGGRGQPGRRSWTPTRRTWPRHKQAGLARALIERLTLTPARLDGVAAGVRDVAALPDPIGETFEMRRMPNGLEVGKRRTPIGVLGVIYESRPNVTIDIAALCFKIGQRGDPARRQARRCTATAPWSNVRAARLCPGRAARGRAAVDFVARPAAGDADAAPGRVH